MTGIQCGRTKASASTNASPGHGDHPERQPPCRILAFAGASTDQPRQARWLLIFASVMTHGIDVADPLVAGEYGKAALKAVSPVAPDQLGRSSVGPRGKLARCCAVTKPIRQFAMPKLVGDSRNAE